MAKEKREGLVKDLAEKVKRGELKPEGAKKEVLRRGLRYVQYKRGSYKFKYHSSHLRKKGGTSDRRETIIFIREGPYKIMRHPKGLNE